MCAKRVLSIQDISCIGQCSLTVALPILSVCGFETCILPTALLSTHTTGFEDYSCLDLTDEMRLIAEHWKQEKLYFDAVYSGYLQNARQAELVNEVTAELGREGCVRIADPAMADGGKLYPEFGPAFVDSMRAVCRGADAVLPNLTEAALLCGREYRKEYDRAYIDGLLSGLLSLGAKTALITGVSFREGYTGVACRGAGGDFYYEHERAERDRNGTGDVFASAFTGALLRTGSFERAVKTAADFTLRCIRNTQEDGENWYGVSFEAELGRLPKLLEETR